MRGALGAFWNYAGVQKPHGVAQRLVQAAFWVVGATVLLGGLYLVWIVAAFLYGLVFGGVLTGWLTALG